MSPNYRRCVKTMKIIHVGARAVGLLGSEIWAYHCANGIQHDDTTIFTNSVSCVGAVCHSRVSSSKSDCSSAQRADHLSFVGMLENLSPAQPVSPARTVDVEWVASVLDSTSARHAARIVEIFRDRWIETTDDLKPLQLLEVPSPARVRTQGACRIGQHHWSQEASACRPRSRAS
jgi:hypothetical protein